MLEINKIYNEDCLEGMKKIGNKSVDFIFTDLPYNTTNNSWECEMPLNDYVELSGQYFYETDLFKLAQVTNSSLEYTRDWFYENKKMVYGLIIIELSKIMAALHYGRNHHLTRDSLVVMKSYIAMSGLSKRPKQLVI